MVETLTGLAPILLAGLGWWLLQAKILPRMGIGT